jgi:outer membrane protein insertion porin family
VAIGSPYTEDSFRQYLTASIRPLYETRGRVRVSFPKLRTEPVKDVEGVQVFVTVDEGESYQLGKVAIEGPAPLDSGVLLKAGDFKPGDVANMTRVTEGLERIRQAVRRAGYMDAKVTSHRKIDDDKKAVDVVVYIDAGPRYSMGKLNITGLDLEGDAAIRKMWGLKFGAPYSPDYPEAFLKRVRDEGLFDDLGETKSEIKLNPDHSADITLVFKGAKPKPRRSEG